MREIIFRGKTKDGKWVYGDLVTMQNICIANTWHEVIRVKDETVGQYTGLKDKNSKMIFEGDIITCINTSKQSGYTIGEKMCGFIEYEECGCYWFCKNNFQHYNDWAFADDIEVIGNIHDNLELLKGGKNEDL